MLYLSQVKQKGINEMAITKDTKEFLDFLLKAEKKSEKIISKLSSEYNSKGGSRNWTENHSHLTFSDVARKIARDNLSEQCS
tara:strand:+ start:474 stop:719 length:246 start_codon:yes stop_codon:yes gene_type:complete